MGSLSLFQLTVFCSISKKRYRRDVVYKLEIIKNIFLYFLLRVFSEYHPHTSWNFLWIPLYPAQLVMVFTGQLHLHLVCLHSGWFIINISSALKFVVITWKVEFLLWFIKRYLLCYFFGWYEINIFFIDVYF